MRSVNWLEAKDLCVAKGKRLLGQAETFTYLDEVERKLEALPMPAEVVQAAVQQEAPAETNAALEKFLGSL